MTSYTYLNPDAVLTPDDLFVLNPPVSSIRTSDWHFELVTARDMDHIGVLRGAQSRSLSVDLNKSGSASFGLPSRSRLAGKIWPWSTAIMVHNGDDVFWSGPVNTFRFDMEAGKVAVTAVGWNERLMHLLLPDLTTTYTNMDAGTIAADLLAKARLQDPNLPIRIGAVETSQLRSITYGIDHNIGQAINDLVELESGFDWYIDPITRELNIVAKRGQDRQDVKWTYISDGRSEHSNLANCVPDVDGTSLVNQIRPRGKFASGYGDDPLSIDRYGVFQEAPSLSDVVDTSILNAYAAAEIVYRSEPRITYTLSPKPESKLSVPRLFREFDIGDTTYLTARRDFWDVTDQAVRVFGASLSISDEGVSQVTNLQVTAG